MKKRFLKLKRVLSVLLSAVMIGSAAFAAAPALAETAPAPSEEDTPVTITPSYSATYAQWKDQEYAQNDIIFLPDEKEKIIPFVIKSKELLVIEAGVLGTPPFTSVTAELYADEACTTRIGNSLYLSESAPYDSDVYAPQQAQTAYLKISLSRNYGDNSTINLSVYSYAVSAANRSIKANGWYVAGFDCDLADQYYKIAVTQPGVVTFTFATFGEDQSYFNVQLLNSSKKAISKTSYLTTALDSTGKRFSVTKTYALKKGYYYIKIHDYNTETVAFKYTFKAVTDQSGASKSKATALTVGGKSKKGLLTQTDKTYAYDYYKLTLTKATAFTISITTQADSSVYLEVSSANGSTVIGGYNNIYNGKNELSTSGTFSKGTYYIKLYKTNAQSSAYYSISIKKQ